MTQDDIKRLEADYLQLKMALEEKIKAISAPPINVYTLKEWEALQDKPENAINLIKKG